MALLERRTRFAPCSRRRRRCGCQSLGKLLLSLEQAGSDELLVDSIFRELHTIKGSSAVAGLTEVSHLAHELEELVEDLRAGRSSATPELIDTLLAGVDGLTALIATVVSVPGIGTAMTSQIAGAPNGANGKPPVEKRSPPGGNGVPASAGPARQPTAAPAKPKGSGLLPRPRPDSESGGGVVMVPLERLDELSRLVSESASAHLRVGRMLSDRFGTDPASIAEFNELSRSLNDLQDRAMRTQMVAVATITDVLQRTIRDLARSQGKDIRWDARGTDTELDRGVLHRLSDSLLHLVRNAVDHGIETPQERKAAGKPAPGHDPAACHATGVGGDHRGHRRRARCRPRPGTRGSRPARYRHRRSQR